MKTHIAISLLIVGALASPIAALADNWDTNPSGPTEFVKDSAITIAVKSQLAAKHVDSLGNISVDTDRNGVVWLSGTAHTQDAINQAVAVTRATDGVRSVHSTLTVKKPQ